MRLDLRHVWNACLTRRWHTNAHLRDTVDPIDGHSMRVSVLVLKLRPQISREALIYALTHDLGEYATADLNYMVKRENPLLYAEVEAMEEGKRAELGFISKAEIVPEELAIVKLADWLDAWLWMIRHLPALWRREDWQQQLSGNLALADDLGVGEIVRETIEAAVGDLQRGIPA